MLSRRRRGVPAEHLHLPRTALHARPRFQARGAPTAARNRTSARRHREPQPSASASSQGCWQRNSRGRPSTPPPLPVSERRRAAGASHSAAFFECGAPTQRAEHGQHGAAFPAAAPARASRLSRSTEHRRLRSPENNPLVSPPPNPPSKSGAAIRTNGGADKKKKPNKQSNRRQPRFSHPDLSAALFATRKPHN